MQAKNELIKTPEYWFETIQKEIYRQVSDYIKNEGINQTLFAEKLGVTKGYVSQIMKGNLNFTFKNLIKLSLAIDKLPIVEFKKTDDFLIEEKTKHVDLPFNSFFENNNTL